MLRMVLLGLLIPLGVGVLSAMELRTPPRNSAAVVQPVAETTASTSQGVLAKADRLEVAAASSETPLEQIAAVSSETPAQPALVDEPISPPADTGIGSSEPPRQINGHRHDPKSKVTAAARPKPKPKTALNRTAHNKAAHNKTARNKAASIKAADIKRTAIAQRSKAAGNTEPCRLKAFGGLLKALNSNDCEI
jgi:outer membrane biosynthesis protein TonB